ncbi:uncharacterized protein MEPE_04011 [Melanopsichium pennsylvanicum]|uniref:Uncharacterized protein n=1 Tax=Melanopsichium pennsylvanicum TaxID=63383 RepID=A0AAJ4XP22_9BASI|nr:uncharacterized protein MEPE_04011 [Melanopsichium pennsylvanicum]
MHSYSSANDSTQPALVPKKERPDFDSRSGGPLMSGIATKSVRQEKGTKRNPVLDPEEEQDFCHSRWAEGGTAEQDHLPGEEHGLEADLKIVHRESSVQPGFVATEKSAKRTTRQGTERSWTLRDCTQDLRTLLDSYGILAVAGLRGHAGGMAELRVFPGPAALLHNWT